MTAVVVTPAFTLTLDCPTCPVQQFYFILFFIPFILCCKVWYAFSEEKLRSSYVESIFKTMDLSPELWIGSIRLRRRNTTVFLSLLRRRSRIAAVCTYILRVMK